MSPTFWRTTLGTDAATKTDEFSEKLQKAFAPTPTHFRKIILKISHSFTLKKPGLKVRNLQQKKNFGTFPKIHPFWWRHPSVIINQSLQSRNFETIFGPDQSLQSWNFETISSPDQSLKSQNFGTSPSSDQSLESWRRP